MKCVSKLVSWCVSAAAGMSLTGAALAVDYPIITVETDEGTLAAPLRLDNLSVSYVADAETAATTVTFASLGKPTAGTFRKRGSGFVMSSFNMTNFTGTVLIEEGAMCCEGPGSFGPANNTAGALVISNGASLVVAGHKETMVEKGMHLWNPITAEGTGVDGIGAIYNKTTDVSSRNTIRGGLTLAGDTLIGSVSKYELGDKGVPAYVMNGHTLTISGGNGVLVNDAEIDSGNIVLTNNSNLRIQSGFKLYGGDTNTFKICSGSVLTPYNGGSFTAPWTLLLEEGAKLNLTSSSETDQVSKLGVHQWKGPVRLNGVVNVTGDNLSGMSLLGPVTGAGGFAIAQAYVNLTNDLNDFRGPVVLATYKTTAKPTLGLWSSNAWPQANTHVLAVTNGCLYFGKKTNYNLPQIIWHNTGSFTNSCVYGTATYLTTPGIVKSGTRVFEMPGVLTATNRTELRAGVLRLAPPVDVTGQYSVAPGVWECVTNCENTAGVENFTKTDLYKEFYAAHYANQYGMMPSTNGIETALRYCQATGVSKTGGPSWDDYQVARYEGFIWNRSSETQRWSLAMAATYGKCYIDDELVLKQDVHWRYLATNTISISPGPHKFDIRFYNTTYSEGGAKEAYSVQNGLTGKNNHYTDPVGKTNIYERLPETWPKNFGFGIDVQGRSSLYSSDYVKPMNGAASAALEGYASFDSDGAWFTLTTNTWEQSMANGGAAATHLYSSFDTLAAWDGTTLDLGGGDVYVRQLEGFTHATNGTLHVAGAWMLDGAAVKGGAKLTVDNAAKIVFGAGAMIDVDDVMAWRRNVHGTDRVFLEADAVEGAPILSDALASIGVRLTKSGTSYSIFTPNYGTVISIR